MTTSFFHESHIYNLLESSGLNVPKYFSVKNKKDIEDIEFDDGIDVVIKGCANNLWHKSDLGCVKITPFSKDVILLQDKKMRENISNKYEWIETLVVEKVKFKTVGELPTTAFVSIQKDQCCGAVINFGIGGIHTEEWATKLKKPIHIWPTTVCSVEDAFEDIKSSWPGQVWLGDMRQAEPLVSEGEIKKFLNGLWNLANNLNGNEISLLEVNPFVVSEEGRIVALDGVGQFVESEDISISQATFNPQSLLNPQKIAIAGVSSKSSGVGHMILENILKSKMPLRNIRVIKPNTEKILGVECISSCKNLLEDHVDILIIALSAKKTLELFEELFSQGGGAEVVYIVAGGLGDGADNSGYGTKLKSLIRQRRKKGLWTPAIVGPNGLGMIQSPLRLNTLFIPQEKLNISFNENSHMALISQSGAFLITRLSRQSDLSLKYGFSIGNQLDLKLSDFMKCLRNDKDVSVVGLYIEGLDSGDGCLLSKEIKQYKEMGKQVIVYKGGRSEEGAKAAAGHTGAMSGDYELQKKLLHKSGAIVVETFNQFNSIFKWFGSYPNINKSGKIAVVTNAGYETVGSVDILSNQEEGNLFNFSSKQASELRDILINDGLDELVSATNPLDITPMANEENYLNCIEYILSQEVDIVLVGLVPLTKNLETSRSERSIRFAARLKELACKSDKQIGIIIDAGIPYLDYKEVFESLNFPVFESMDQAVLGINILSREK